MASNAAAADGTFGRVVGGREVFLLEEETVRTPVIAVLAILVAARPSDKSPQHLVYGVRSEGDCLDRDSLVGRVQEL